MAKKVTNVTELKQGDYVSFSISKRKERGVFECIKKVGDKDCPCFYITSMGYEHQVFDANIISDIEVIKNLKWFDYESTKEEMRDNYIESLEHKIASLNRELKEAKTSYIPKFDSLVVLALNNEYDNGNGNDNDEYDYGESKQLDKWVSNPTDRKLRVTNKEQKEFVLDKCAPLACEVEIEGGGTEVCFTMDDDYYSVSIDFDTMAEIVDYLREQNKEQVK